MTRVNPHVFRAYDVRGIWRTDFDAAFAQRLGSNVAAYLGGAIVVGRDARASSDEAAYAVIDGALHAGCKVIDVGNLSSPQFYWAIRELGASGGIMVTASHNPDQYNGFKVIGHGGEVIGGGHLRQIYDSHGHRYNTTGELVSEDIIPRYANAIAQAAQWSGDALQVSLDAPAAVRRALEYITPIAPDHGLAAKFDMDGDRIQFFQSGQPIAADWIFLLLAEKLRLQPLVFDLRFSRAVQERLDERAIHYYISKVGRLYLTDTMQQSGAELGAETSGHFYFKSFNGMEAPELVLLHVARIIAESGESLETLLAPRKKYFKSEEISIQVKDAKFAMQAMEHIRNKYLHCFTNYTDGLTVDCWDQEGWWLNIRPSNTEPLLRLVIEAQQKNLLDQKVAEVRALLS